MGQPQLKPTQEAKPTEAPSAPQVAPAPDPGGENWVKPKSLTRRGWTILAVVVLVFQLPLLFKALRGTQPVTASVPYQDDFSSRDNLARNYWSTGGDWRVVNGELVSPGVKNNPLWLQASLPEDVAVEFDVRSESPEGDIKVEIFGDGLNHASGYVLIHGGWNNRLSVIARLDEHGTSLPDLERKARKIAEEKKLPGTGVVEAGVFRDDTHMRVEASPYPVQMGRMYHWRIERRGSLIRWSIDGKPFMQFDDPFPLRGKGHDRFGFSSWEAQLYFDNLRILPL